MRNLHILGESRNIRAVLGGLTKLVRDIIGIVISLDRARALWRHPLYSNAIYIMSANVANAVVGLVFWIAAARLYPTDDVGRASALLSAATLLTTLSGLGFGYGLIRYLGESKNPVGLVNSSFAVVVTVSVAAVAIYVVGPGVWSPALVSLRHQPACLALFMLSPAGAAVASLLDNTFIARRTGRLVLARNLVFNLLRLVLPIALAACLRSFGLFVSWSVGVFVSLLIGLSLLLPRTLPGYRPGLSFDGEAVRSMFRFSFANYMSDLFWTAPILILQSIVVAKRLGSESNAYFAVAWAMGSVLTSLPLATSLSLFAEGSHDEAKLERTVWQSLKMTFLILTPAVLLVVVLANRLLLVFRPEYAENATTLLRLFAVSAFPVAVNFLYFGRKRVERRMRGVILLIILAGSTTLLLSYLLMPELGISGVGVAWLAGQSLTSLMVVASWIRKARSAVERG